MTAEEQIEKILDAISSNAEDIEFVERALVQFQVSELRKLILEYAQTAGRFTERGVCQVAR